MKPILNQNISTAPPVAKSLMGLPRAAVVMSLTTFMVLMAGPVLAAKPLTIDDLGFSRVMDDQLFTSGFAVSSTSSELPVNSGNSVSGVKLHSMMEVSVDGSGSTNKLSSGSGVDLAMNEVDQADGIDIRRFSTSIESSQGVLTVGNNWSNFQDFLGGSDSVLGVDETLSLGDTVNAGSVTSHQIRWNGRNGLGVALENNYRQSSVSLDDDEVAIDDGSVSPSLVLSWEGATNSGRGQYRMSAMGRGVESKDDAKSDIGWGVNLAGGWKFGDLFAKLTLTLGNSIDSFILSRFSSRNKQADNRYGLNDAFSISPSLNYQLSDKGNLHLSVNRFQSAETESPHGVDTLDTVHLGYSWNPWPSTLFGIEFVGKEVDGNTAIQDSNEVNFAARKQF